VNGLLVPAKDPDALAAEISKLLADAPLRQRLARAARETVLAKFDFASLLNSLRSLYQGPRMAPLAIRGRQTIAIE
jgi:glycosyltransferase involved in cell wall biosynthesis